jgi:hypothetical protein
MLGIYSLECLLLIDIVNLFLQGRHRPCPLTFPGVATLRNAGRSLG